MLFFCIIIRFMLEKSILSVGCLDSPLSWSGGTQRSSVASEVDTP